VAAEGTAGPAAEHVHLDEGLELLLRPLRDDDKRRLAQAFERLSPETRYRRFFSPLEKLSETDLRYLTEVDHRDHEALIACDTESGEAIGVARFVRLDDGESAEAAVTVIDEWQGRGAGTALANLLAERAREEGIKRFTALLLTENEQMRELLTTLGPAKVISRDGGTIVIEVEIPEQGIGEHMAGVLRVAAGGTVELATPPWGLAR